ncbi:serine/threonine-protein kinase/endoribonuclease IRE1a [Trifolium repens]|nr:serine/threonine-protein kinase/endoribonuclease IRE1a [Trifolium repens]
MSSIIFGSFTPAAAAAITNSLAENAVTKYSDPFAFAEEEKIKIADGSDGTQVWEVKATLDSKDFALKSIPDEKRAMTEFAAYRRLEDQNIIRCYSCTKVDNGYQLLLERGECTLLELIKVCNGGLPTHENPNREKKFTWAKQYVTLWEDFYRPAGDKLARPNRTPSTTLVSLLRDIVKGVVYLHKMDVAHGRLNPNNILIFKNRDNSLRAKLSHFGCSSSGSPGWQTPEQREGVLR